MICRSNNDRGGIFAKLEAEQERTVEVFERIETAFQFALVFEVVKPESSGVDGLGIVGEVQARQIRIGLDGRPPRRVFDLPPDAVVCMGGVMEIPESNEWPDFESARPDTGIAAQRIPNDHCV